MLAFGISFWYVTKYVIDKKIKEKDEEIAKMRQAMRTVLDTVDEMRNDFIANKMRKWKKTKRLMIILEK